MPNARGPRWYGHLRGVWKHRYDDLAATGRYTHREIVRHISTEYGGVSPRTIRYNLLDEDHRRHCLDEQRHAIRCRESLSILIMDAYKAASTDRLTIDQLTDLINQANGVNLKSDTVLRYAHKRRLPDILPLPGSNPLVYRLTLHIARTEGFEPLMAAIAQRE